MAFEIYSKTGSELTYSRESENFSRMMRKGVYSGMQVYRGSSGFDVSINAGYFSVAGRLVRSTIAQTNVITVPSPVADEHHLIWVDVSDPANPSFEIKSGGIPGLPAALSPSEEATGLVLADIWVPTGAVDITDCIISNRDLIDIGDRGFDAHWLADKLVVSDNAGNTRVTYTNVKISVVMRNSESRKSNIFFLSGTNVVVDDSSADNNRFSVICVRSNSRFSDPLEALQMEIIHMDDDPEVGSDAFNDELVGNDDGNFAVATDKDAFPYRPNLEGLYILAIHDRTAGIVQYLGYGTTPEGSGVVGGVLDNVVNTITSTAYSTSESGNSVNIDDVITNISTIRSADMTDVYNSMGIGSSGSGRTMEVTRGPLEIRHSGYDSFYASNDNFVAAQRFKLDSDDDGVLDKSPVAVDIYTNNQSKGERALVLRRPATVDSDVCFNGNATLVNAVSRVEVAALDAISTASFFNQFTNTANDRAAEYILEIEEDLAGRASGAIFRIGVDLDNDVFYLINLDTGATVLPAELSTTVFPKTCTGTVTLWETHIDAGFESTKIRNLEVSESITGLSGRPAKTFATSLPIDRSDMDSNMKHGETSIVKTSSGRGAYTQVISSGTFGSYAGNVRMYSDGVVLITAGFTSGNPIAVSVWNIDTGAQICTFSTSQNATSNNVGYLSCIRDNDLNIIAVPVGRRVEYFGVDTLNGTFFAAGSINYGDGATDECRVCVPVNYDRFWVGGSHSSDVTAHNMELHSITTSNVVARYRVGKNALTTVNGDGLKFNGSNLVALGIHGTTADISTLASINLNSDGTMAQVSSGSFFANRETFFKNSWSDYIIAPTKVACTDDAIIVYGTDSSDMAVLERYPMQSAFGRLGITPLTITYTPTHHVVLDVDPSVGTLTSSPPRVFDTTDDNSIVLVANDVATGVDPAEYAMTYIFSDKDLSVKWGALYSRVTFSKLNVVAGGACDGASVYFGDDAASSGAATIYRMDTSNGSKLGHMCSRGGLVKRSVVYDNKH